MPVGPKKTCVGGAAGTCRERSRRGDRCGLSRVPSLDKWQSRASSGRRREFVDSGRLRCRLRDRYDLPEACQHVFFRLIRETAYVQLRLSLVWDRRDLSARVHHGGCDGGPQKSVQFRIFRTNLICRGLLRAYGFQRAQQGSQPGVFGELRNFTQVAARRSIEPNGLIGIDQF